MTALVVPLDGSTFAERSLQPACSIAARFDQGRVVLVTVDAGDVDLDAIRVQLEDRAALYGETVEIETRFIEDEDPALAILSAVASEPDAVLCMATHGRRGIGAAVLGGVAKTILSRSTEPLVLVGPHCRTALLPAERGRLLVCSDGSALSDSIIPVAAHWGEQLQLERCVTEVVPPDEYPVAANRPTPNREEEAAAARLAELSARLTAPGAPARFEVLHGAPSRSIIGLAERLPAAMIAMATHGRSGLTRITMGSVATDVVRHAPCPVLIMRPTDSQASIDE